jgi:hypothetical protein
MTSEEFKGRFERWVLAHVGLSNGQSADVIGCIGDEYGEGAVALEPVFRFGGNQGESVYHLTPIDQRFPELRRLIVPAHVALISLFGLNEEHATMLADAIDRRNSASIQVLEAAT